MGAALSELLSRLGSRIESAESLAADSSKLSLGWPELDAALPDGGLPRGVVELAAPRALGGAASIALAAIRAAHERDAKAWCAWVDPEATLYAPGVAFAGVDLERLLVIRPPRAEVARIAVKVAASRAFDVIAIDVDVVPGASAAAPTKSSKSTRNKRSAWPMDVLVRKLALLAAEGGATVLLLSDSSLPRAVTWPVALRLELSRTPDAIALRVAKDRRGRVGAVGVVKAVPWRSRPTSESEKQAG
jgi:recombination protein RecA